MSRTSEIVTESGPMETGVRAKLVEDVFHRYLEAQREMSLALQRCALKGWPDRRALIRNATHLQELFYERLSLRLKHLVLRSASDDMGWNDHLLV